MPGELEARLEALYGTAALAATGIVHVTSAARAADGRLHVLRIGPGAPRSTTDFFILNLCRARADAILTTASILRHEPDLRLGLQGDAADALAQYRRGTLRKSGSPWCAILTATGALPEEHPVWQDASDKLVLTRPEVRAAVASRLGARAEVVGLEPLDARRACALLVERGARLVSVEAGPSASASLYEPPAQVDELLLSLYEGPLADVALAPALPADAQLLGGLRCVASTVRAEESGPWRFQRFSRG